ncbi:MOSC domain-containing protein [Flavobacterium sp.]|uniref:MOSC domain-containing protein n=1 Tax=Flavobacterium sp. TaxID=239 RepID=UPI003C673159
MLELSQIWIYPIKSLSGICLEQSNLTPRGLEHDRRWMLVDQKAVFLTQRTYPQLALFQPEIQEDCIKISHADTSKGSVKFSLSQKNTDSKFNVAVWEDTVEVLEVDAEISAWFTQILGFSVRLVFMPEESHRTVDPDYAVSPEDKTAFTDGFPFLIIGQASLDDLNLKLETPLSIQRFRPNFVFTGGIAYEEENWYEFTIENQTFYGVKPSSRCIMTTIDFKKGIFSGKEPLFTLSKYKKVGSKVIFGQNVIAKNYGKIRIGNVIKLVHDRK